MNSELRSDQGTFWATISWGFILGATLLIRLTVNSKVLFSNKCLDEKFRLETAEGDNTFVNPSKTSQGLPIAQGFSVPVRLAIAHLVLL